MKLIAKKVASKIKRISSKTLKRSKTSKIKPRTHTRNSQSVEVETSAQQTYPFCMLPPHFFDNPRAKKKIDLLVETPEMEPLISNSEVHRQSSFTIQTWSGREIIQVES